MDRTQVLVQQFHRAVGLSIGTSPQIQDGDLRAALIEEESTETTMAIRRHDFLAAIDGLCDVLYVVYGTAVSFGIDLEPFFELVHEANMKKVGGPIRADGKRLKPAGWKQPDLATELERQRVLALTIAHSAAGEQS
jgi:predicted HAD superfamily Cof-like phosphohydrolase